MPDKPEKIDLTIVTFTEGQPSAAPPTPDLATVDDTSPGSVPPQFKPVLDGLEDESASRTVAPAPGSFDDYEDEDLPAADGSGSPPLMTFQWGGTPFLGDEESTLVPLNQTEAGELGIGDLAINGDLELSGDVSPTDVDSEFDAEV